MILPRLLVCLLYCFDEIKFEFIVESVTPAKAGVQPTMALRYWIPACAGMTKQ